MPRPTETMISAAVRSTARADSRNGASGFCRMDEASSVGVNVSTGAEPDFERIRAPRARLQGREVRTAARHAHIAVQFSLEQQPHEHRRAGFDFHRDHVADQHLGKSRRQLRREVAHLIGVGKQHQRGAAPCGSVLRPPRCSRRRCSPSADRARRRRPSRISSSPLRRPARRRPIPGMPHADRHPSAAAELLAGRQRLPRHAMPLAALSVPEPLGRSYDPHLELQLLHQLRGRRFRVAFENLRLLALLRHVDFFDRCGRYRGCAQAPPASPA